MDLRDPIDDQTFEETNAAWLANNILLFRGQELTRPLQIAFARRFGELVISGTTASTHPDHPEFLVISNVKINGEPVGQLPEDTGEGWHSDHIFMDTPPNGSFFYAEEAPSEGGDTWFATDRRLRRST